jgi:hypothetical protein
MQTSKFLFALGAFSAVILPLQVQAAPDNAEQARMRAELRRMMESNPPQSGSAASATPAAAPVVPAPVRSGPEFGPVPPPSQPGVSPAAPVVPFAPPPPVIIPAAPVAVLQPEQPTFGPVPPPNDTASIAQARQLMRQKLQELAAASSPATLGAPAATAYTAIQVPGSPFSAAKQAKLADLLVRYKADTITAQEYHAQRAAIIAEP